MPMAVVVVVALWFHLYHEVRMSKHHRAIFHTCFNSLLTLIGILSLFANVWQLLYQRQESKALSPSDQGHDDDHWDFGQVAALFAWAPSLMDWLPCSLGIIAFVTVVGKGWWTCQTSSRPSLQVPRHRVMSFAQKGRDNTYES